MVTVEIAQNGYVVRSDCAGIAIAHHYEEVGHYVSHFLYREGSPDHVVPGYKDSESTKAWNEIHATAKKAKV